MSATITTTESFRRVAEATRALDVERNHMRAFEMAHYSRDGVGDVSAVLSGAKGLSALYVSFRDFTTHGPDAIVDAMEKAKSRKRPLFVYMRPNLPESALDINNPAFLAWLELLSFADFVQLTIDELYSFSSSAADDMEATTQLCQKFNLKGVLVYDERDGSAFVATRDLSEPDYFTLRSTARRSNVEDDASGPSDFSRHILYSLMELDALAHVSSGSLTTLVKNAASTNSLFAGASAFIN